MRIWKVIKTLVWAVQAQRVVTLVVLRVQFLRGYRRHPVSVRLSEEVVNGWHYAKDKSVKMSRVWIKMSTLDVTLSFCRFLKKNAISGGI